MNLSFSYKEYEEYLKKKDEISNSRIRPDGMDFFDWLSSEKGDMSKTPEGQQLIAALQSIDD
ncbi:hypothetical protein LQZ19_09205 [Treponema primitia]|uniref:hypothetical protein n=1 Tax=Treponema primitia TaxID=88058 RepID=UPI00397FD7E8